MTVDARAAVVECIMRLQQTGDPRCVLEPTIVDAADQLARESYDDPAVNEMLGWFHLYRYLALPTGADASSHAAAISHFTRAFGAVPPALRQVLSEDQTSVEQQEVREAVTGEAFEKHQQALQLLRNAMALDDADAVERGVRLLRSAVDEIPEGHPGRWMSLFNLGAAQLELYRLRRRLEELDASITALRAAVVECARAGSNERPEVLTRLGTAHRERFLATDDPADINAVVDVIGDAAAETSSASPKYPRRLGKYSMALGERFDRFGAREDIDGAIDAARRAADVVARGTGGDLDECVLMLTNLGILLEKRFSRFDMLADLDASIAAHESAVALLIQRKTAPLTGEELVVLSTTLGTRVATAGYSDELSGAIETLARGAQRLPEHDPDRAIPLSYIADRLRQKYEQTGSSEDLDAAISLTRTALHVLPPDHPARGNLLVALISDLLDRAKRTDCLDDLNEAIDTGRSLAATESELANAPATLHNLALGLYRRFTATSQAEDLDEAIKHFTRVLALAPDAPLRPYVQDSLGNTLAARYEATGSVADLDAAIEHLQEAVDSVGTEDARRSGMLSNLAGALVHRYHRYGTDADLESAIDHLEAALESSVIDRDSKATCLINLGMNRMIRFHRDGQLPDLSTAIDLLQQALTLTRDGRDPAPFLAGLATAHLARFDALGAVTDLDLAIDHLEESIRLTPGSHTALPGRLSNLGAAYKTRFVRTGRTADLTAAIDCLQLAVRRAPMGFVGLGAIFSNLGNALSRRFRETGDLDDLDRATAALRDAKQAEDQDSLQLTRYRVNLASILTIRAEEGNSERDSEDAVAQATQAVESESTGSVIRAGAEAALSRALMSRFQHSRTHADLDLAIAHGTAATEALAEDHPDRASYLHNLGTTYMMAAKAKGTPTDTPQGARQDHQRLAVTAFRQAAQAASAGPTSRCRSGMSWGRAAADMAEWGEAVAGFRTAIEQLPLVAGRELSRGDQEHQLSQFGGLATEAAAAALDNNDPVAAMTLLDQGRGILLAQALQVRTDLTELRQRKPNIADRFTTLRDELDAGSSDTGLYGPEETVAHDQTVARRRRLATELDELIARIRTLEGFGSFLLPPTPEEIVSLTTMGGPIAAINTDARRSDALIAFPGGILTVPLPDAGLSDVTHRTRDFMAALEANDWASSRTMLDVLGWLWDAVAEPVLAALAGADTTQPWRRAQAADPYPRLWWLPTGPLTLLPLHAAGHHGRTLVSGAPTVLDRVVSSYTPTMSSLRHARQGRRYRDTDRALIIAIADTPGLGDDARLEHAELEAGRIAAHLGSQRPPLLGPAASRANVLAELPQSLWAHFACHAVSDPDNPSASFLHLHDGPLTVLDLAGLRMDNAHLAYLSACSTARSGLRLLDESIHLSSAFQLAGFSHVVGTLWPISDDIAARVADETYREISDHPNQVARTLHQATLQIRDSYPRNPRLWAAHVHVGP